MGGIRRCSRTACGEAAAATLTYVYSESTALVGPLAENHEPHCYDLCERHAERLTAPRGWAVERQPIEAPLGPRLRSRSGDDLEALADAVREAAWGSPDGSEPPGIRRGHLRILPSPG